MKKTKLLALTLVVAMMLMGAGYAFWSEVLAIDATVDTGELDFGFDDEYFSGGSYVTGTADVNAEDDNILELVFHNMHPGSTARVGFSLNNTGTIGLKLEDFKVLGDDPNLDQLMVITNDGPITLEAYFATLEGLFIDVGAKVYKEIEVYVKKCATEQDFAELADFEFSVQANVKQYNDDGSCDPVDPENPDDPEITGLRFKKTKVENVKKSSNDKYIWGTFYYTWDEGDDTVAGTISKVRINSGSSETFTYGDYSITIRNNRGNLSW